MATWNGHHFNKILNHKPSRKENQHHNLLNTHHCTILHHSEFQITGSPHHYAEQGPHHESEISYLICILWSKLTDGSTPWNQIWRRGIRTEEHRSSTCHLCRLLPFPISNIAEQSKANQSLLTWDKKGGLFSILPLLQMNTTPRPLSAARFTANWKRSEVFPLALQKKRTRAPGWCVGR